MTTVLGVTGGSTRSSAAARVATAPSGAKAASRARETRRKRGAEVRARGEFCAHLSLLSPNRLGVPMVGPRSPRAPHRRPMLLSRYKSGERFTPRFFLVFRPKDARTQNESHPSPPDNAWREEDDAYAYAYAYAHGRERNTRASHPLLRTTRFPTASKLVLDSVRSVPATQVVTCGDPGDATGDFDEWGASALALADGSLLTCGAPTASVTFFCQTEKRRTSLSLSLSLSGKTGVRTRAPRDIHRDSLSLSRLGKTHKTRKLALRMCVKKIRVSKSQALWEKAVSATDRRPTSPPRQPRHTPTDSNLCVSPR